VQVAYLRSLTIAGASRGIFCRPPPPPQRSSRFCTVCYFRGPLTLSRLQRAASRAFGYGFAAAKRQSSVPLSALASLARRFAAAVLALGSRHMRDLSRRVLTQPPFFRYEYGLLA